MINILVTGVGAIIGYGVIKSLRSSRYDINIIGIDIYSDAIGQNWCDAFEQVIPVIEPEYTTQILNILTKHKIDLIIPAIEQDVIFWAENDINNIYSKAKVALNNRDLIFTAYDKWRMHKKLLQYNLPTILSCIEPDFESIKNKFGLPFMLKPRCSYASKGIIKIFDSSDFKYWKGKSGGNYMFQQYIGSDDEEYTASIFGYGDGNSSNSIIFKRKLSAEGATKTALVVQDDLIDWNINKLVKIFKPIGPTNFQFRKNNDDFLLLEINPRISSSTSIRSYFGYNESEMCLQYYLNGERPDPVKVIKGKAIRYIEDFIYDTGDNS
jgi:carbamoyl-phosphate synthase large subunit